ncbi:ornithine cyclodeaminase family protein [Enterococcus sp. 669A]|uniref:Ornithine cyclodeaminase family protein n=1 Tax=Candidatus Enterococcus moelleringii TaxID=2815325 RepID=A0ABS3LGJ9_9ENTE|nr:ornithine cyclodeaminase family protein [Enterococcus sp. 669A]MBO1308758.1 ornithine cyclodeaminase family protein [Enterococcus sp. 669A]
MLFLTKNDMIQTFSMEEALEADKQALMVFSKGETNAPLRTNVDIREENGVSSYMPAYIGGEKPSLGVKIVSTYLHNIERGLPSVTGTMILLDPKTGIVTALLDGTYLTQLRTGAVQGVATEILARKDAKIGALIGTGGQAEKQLEAMLTARPLTEVRIFDLSQKRAECFAEDMQKKFSARLIPTKTSRECVEGADIITSATPSNEPTFESDWVKDGAHINGIGSFTPSMFEIPKELIKRADRVIFDTTEGVLNAAGDFITPLKEEYIPKNKYSGELGQILLGEVEGRTSDDEITIFKSVGTAVLDLVVASQIVQKAREKGLGTEIPD